MSRPISGTAKSARALGALALIAAIAILLQACSSVPRRLAAPQADLLGLSLLRASSDGQLFSLRVKLVNPNAADIPVIRMDFDIRLGGEGRLIGEYATPFTLPGQSSETIEVEVFSKLVSSASRLMAFSQGLNDALAYEFQGELVLDAGFREPLLVFRRGQVPFIIAREE